MKGKAETRKQKAEIMMHRKNPFEWPKVTLALDVIRPREPEVSRGSRRYQAVLASIREVGLVEPLMVCADRARQGEYFLLDGNVRFAALQELGKDSAECVVAGADVCPPTERKKHE